MQMEEEEAGADVARNTPRDADVSDFLAGKRDDVPNIGSGLPKPRVDSIMRQWNAQPAQQLQKAKGERAAFEQDQLGTQLSALQGPSLNLTGRLRQALTGDDAAKTQKTIDGAVEEHPVANVVGAVAGGPAGAETFGGRLLISGLQGAVSSAARAKDGHVAQDAETGGAGSAITSALAEALIRGGGKLTQPVLKKVAQTQALRALNPLKRDVTMMANQGIESKVADDLLSSGVMRPGSNSAGIAQRVAPELEQRGQAVGAARQAVDKAGGGNIVRPKDLGDSLRKLADEYRAKPVPEMQSIADDLERRAELLDKMPVGTTSLEEAEQNIKKPLDVYAEKAARTVGTPPDKLEAMAQARRVIKEGNENAAKAVDPALADKFIGAKKDYGSMATAANILERNNPRALANRGLSPSDYGFGIATGQGYRPPASNVGEEPGEQAIAGVKGMLAAALHKQVRERGNSTLAHVANVGSKAAGIAGTGALTAPLSRVSNALAPYEALLWKKDEQQSPEYQHAVDDWRADRTQQEKLRQMALAVEDGQ